MDLCNLYIMKHLWLYQLANAIYDGKIDINEFLKIKKIRMILN